MNGIPGDGLHQEHSRPRWDHAAKDAVALHEAHVQTELVDHAMPKVALGLVAGQRGVPGQRAVPDAAPHDGARTVAAFSSSGEHRPARPPLDGPA